MQYIILLFIHIYLQSIAPLTKTYCMWMYKHSTIYTMTLINCHIHILWYLHGIVHCFVHVQKKKLVLFFWFLIPLSTIYGEFNSLSSISLFRPEESSIDFYIFISPPLRSFPFPLETQKKNLCEFSMFFLSLHCIEYKTKKGEHFWKIIIYSCVMLSSVEDTRILKINKIK